MNTQKLPIEDQTNFEELLESHLDIPQVEEEGMLEVSASPKKENAAKPAECVMPNEKQIHLKHRKRKVREKKQTLRGLAKTRSILAKRTKSKNIAKKQEKTEKFLQAMKKETSIIQNMDEYEFPISAAKASNNFFSTFDEFQSSGFPLEEKMNFKKRQTAWICKSPPQGVIFFF